MEATCVKRKAVRDRQSHCIQSMMVSNGTGSPVMLASLITEGRMKCMQVMLGAVNATHAAASTSCATCHDLHVPCYVLLCIAGQTWWEPQASLATEQAGQLVEP